VNLPATTFHTAGPSLRLDKLKKIFHLIFVHGCGEE